MNVLDLIRLKIADHLCAIERLLPAEYSLTCFARHRKNDQAHIMVSTDTPEELAAAIEQLQCDEERKGSS